ncbi:5-formyltetrahydrofolate cyclo-ligase [Bacillus sp. PS06]|uniref:5-formyltetrahydrofolate cyclo-ligase n=1 Tax=Bacillus sp. PS06 TaxID=2764176 RepID=UPI001781CC9C|nr:5-formyltetrahydrofolate cyclo-ligase [Bacillus sp. PS06]MBD8069142.1 5-formyltetrahydrofolate cyclo-ligase [Bacillus sp. PS06]
MILKQNLREMMREKLRDIDEHTFEKWSNEIQQKVFQTVEWKEAKTIGITISTTREVSTIKIIEQAWLEGKTVCVPKCEPTTKKMDFRQITSFDQLEVVYFSLKEPIEEKTVLIAKDEIDLLFVPGLAFTENGYRLGQGGGYYDRYLLNFNRQTMSLVFDLAIVEDLPIDHYDLPVQQIVTNKRVIDCHG